MLLSDSDLSILELHSGEMYPLHLTNNIHSYLNGDELSY